MATAKSIPLLNNMFRLNSFIYACKKRDDFVNCRVLPLIMAKTCEQFSFKGCTFGIQGFKLSAARAVVWNMIDSLNVFTIETSFFGF